MDVDSPTTQSLKAATDNTRPDMMSNNVATTVSDTAPLSLQHPTQQQGNGMMIVN